MNKIRKKQMGEFNYTCQECGQGTVSEIIIPEYPTMIRGCLFVVTNASIGECDKCGAKHFSAIELRRWERQQDQKQKQ
jgi:YgiT-type zinc finger domain-containing protein